VPRVTSPVWTTVYRLPVLPPCGFWVPRPWRGPGSPACRPRPSLDQAQPGTRSESRPLLLAAQCRASIPGRVPRVTSPAWTTACAVPGRLARTSVLPPRRVPRLLPPVPARAYPRRNPPGYRGQTNPRGQTGCPAQPTPSAPRGERRGYAGPGTRADPRVGLPTLSPRGAPGVHPRRLPGLTPGLVCPNDPRGERRGYPPVGFRGSPRVVPGRLPGEGSAGGTPARVPGPPPGGSPGRLPGQGSAGGTPARATRVPPGWFAGN